MRSLAVALLGAVEHCTQRVSYGSFTQFHFAAVSALYHATALRYVLTNTRKGDLLYRQRPKALCTALSDPGTNLLYRLVLPSRSLPCGQRRTPVFKTQFDSGRRNVVVYPVRTNPILSSLYATKPVGLFYLVVVYRVVKCSAVGARGN